MLDTQFEVLKHTRKTNKNHEQIIGRTQKQHRDKYFKRIFDILLIACLNLVDPVIFLVKNKR